MKMKSILAALAILTLAACSAPAQKEKDTDSKVVVAYVTSWTDIMPDPTLMTHINYSFAHVDTTFDKVRIDNPDRLREIVKLKEQAPDLNVMVSIGGWGSGRFSEMAADPALRDAFCKDCKRIVDEFNLDGIDIDWEYPSSNAAGISSSKDDIDNFTLLMKGIRAAIGEDKYLTLATSAGAGYYKFTDFIEDVDFVNIMAYDMANAPKHHSPLYASPIANGTSDGAVKKHILAGVPANKLVLGMPFYGRGGQKYAGYQDFNKVAPDPELFTVCWDDEAKVPYIMDKEGDMVFGFENEKSLGIKCDYILENDLHGAMYWEYGGNDENLTLSKVLANKLIGVKDGPKVLLLTERGGQHGPFTDAAIEWLKKESEAKGYTVTEINRSRPITKEFLAGYKAIIQLDYVPYGWSEVSQEAFIDYIENGKGGWVGFHHASLLGNFDGFKMWNWFSDYMGGIVYNNYIAELSSGNVTIEDTNHPVTNGVSGTFFFEDDEWYIYDKSPRANVRVLASVDEDTYTTETNIKMGDHPVIWTNENVKARNVYFQMGHSPKLLTNEAFTTMFSNAIDWAMGE